MGPINEQALTDLHLISQLVKLFGAKPHDAREADFESFPDFFWCLRDFCQDISEDFTSPKDYMEDCLKPVLGVDTDTMKKNQIRKSIRNYFTQRDCFTFISPVEDETQLAQIEDMQYEDLKEDFRNQADSFLQELKQKSKSKTLKLKDQKKMLNGQMLLGLAMDFCEAVNADEAPKIDNSVSRVVQEETRVIQDDSFLELQNMLEEDIGLEPIQEDQIDSIIKKSVQETIKGLQLKLSRFLEFSEVLEETTKFKQRMAPMLKEKKDVNYTQGFHFSRQLLSHLVDKQNRLEIEPVSQEDINDICKVEADLDYQDQNVEELSQKHQINSIFKQWQKVIRLYRGGNETDNMDEDEEASQEE